MNKAKLFGLCIAVAGLCLVTAARSDDLLVSGEAESNGLSIVVSAPGEFTNRVEIYTCSNLVSGDWRVAAVSLRPVDGNPARWYTGISNGGFFVAGNMDIDSDGDGIPDAREKYVYKTSPDKWDSAGDWISDGWKVAHSLNPLIPNRAVDSDSDGLDNSTEYMWGTDPLCSDSDGDGMPDAWELNAGMDPLMNDAGADPDGDGLTNHEEFFAGTNPMISDTDADGIPDGFEAHHGMNPCDSRDAMNDLDGDLVPNLYEYLHSTDPSNPVAVPVPDAVVSLNGHDGTFTDIQAAINSVANNEYPVIFIEPGIYNMGAAAELALTNVLIYAAPGTVVLDGNGSSRLFDATYGWPVLAGLTLQNGYSADNGGAIYVSGAGSIIRNCVFSFNRAETAGGAIYAGSETMEVFNCVFNDNQALQGGAVYSETAGSELNHCTLLNNHAWERGGAIYNGTAINCVVWSNRADLSDAQIYGATVSYSCIEDGYSGASNIDVNPRLVQLWHTASEKSSVVNCGNRENAANFDLNGGLRDALPDMGADEWVDMDTDDLPDWWEKLWFGRLDAVSSGQLADTPGRSLTYRQKYLYGLSPSFSDTDSDGLSDWAEIYIYKTDPLATTDLSSSLMYSMKPTDYEWIDISQTGQDISEEIRASTYNNFIVAVPLGFEFPYAGTTSTNIYVSAQGFVSLDEYPMMWGIAPLPSAQIAPRTLCAFWHECYLINSPDAAVYVQSETDRCIISFEDSSRLSFQMVLRADGGISYNYKAIDFSEIVPIIGAQWESGSVEFAALKIRGRTSLAVEMNTDADGDGVSDIWEMKWFGTPDTVTDGGSFVGGTGVFTYAEAAYLGLNPNATSANSNGWSVAEEIIFGPDSDGDGMSDRFEMGRGLDPFDPSDALIDSDGDGFPNVYECRHGTDLFDANSFPPPDRYVSLSGQHIAPFNSNMTAATNIQSVLSLINDYDIISISDGTYCGPENRNLNSLGHPFMLFSESGPENCILDGENEARSLILGNMQQDEFLKNPRPGFFILRGLQFFQDTPEAIGPEAWQAWSWCGGAVFCRNSNLLIENCIFRSNVTANAWGASAVYGENMGAVFKDCLFDGNEPFSPHMASSFDPRRGMLHFYSSDVQILNSTATGNRGHHGLLFYDSSLRMDDCSFTGNSCSLLTAENGSVRINRCLFLQNDPLHEALITGGDSEISVSDSTFRRNPGSQGVINIWNGESDFLNCLFLENGISGGEDVGVFNFMGAASARLQNCTLYSNDCFGVLGFANTGADAGISVRNTILWGNSKGSYPAVTGWGWSYEVIRPVFEFCCLPEVTGTNNIHINPMLNSVTGEPLPNSPCIDHGSDQGAPEKDPAGNPRWDHPLWSNDADSSVTDIGVFEFSDSDTDGDGLGDKWEIFYFTNITVASGREDFDQDGVSVREEYRYNTHPLCADTDSDGLSDREEIVVYGTDPNNPDTDFDGLTDADEIRIHHTDSKRADTDGDGLNDGDEVYLYDTNPLDPATDADGDGLRDCDEILLYGTDRLCTDTDGDGLSDWDEIFVYGTNPNVSDTDDDGLNDGEEILVWSTNPLKADSDDDGMPDKWEFDRGLQPLVDDALLDPDGDGLVNLKEYRRGGDPYNSDSPGAGTGMTVNEIYGDSDGRSSYDWLMCDGYGGPGGDANDNGQLNCDEFHRYPSFSVSVAKDTKDINVSPPEFLFQGAVTKRNPEAAFVSTVPGPEHKPEVNYVVFLKEFFGEPGARYRKTDITAVNQDGSIHEQRLMRTSALVAEDSSFIYPYSLDYRIKRAAAGAYGRRMSVPLNNTPGCLGDTNAAGLVVFKRIIIHPDAPTPRICLSASSNLRLYRASNGQPITFHTRGETQPEPAEDISAELRTNDLAVLVVGAGAGSPAEQGLDYYADESFYAPYYGPYVGALWPTSCGSWGSYVGLYCGDAVTRYSYFENDMPRFSVEVRIEPKLVPDWNRDRQIDLADENESTNGLPFRFWINDDSDSGDIAEGDSDIPGQKESWLPRSRTPNCKDQKVNGRCDLTDFFPVWLDIGLVLAGCPVTNGFTYRLSQASNALQFVYTDLAKTNAGDYLITDISSCGSNFTQNVRDADAIQITSGGVDLSSEFIERIIENPNNGILLMEAIRPSTAPLILQVLSNDTVVARTELPLRLSGVEDMFRHKNLRPEIGGDKHVDDRSTAPNWPDSLCSTTNLFFLHGFSVDEQSSRGWQAEMFKRLYWSGSKARFHAITWRGDESGVVDPWYQRNVNHAFQTAPYLKNYVESIGGSKIMLAHSLGNMVVSSAIQDYGMSVQKYLMLDAAVASEAFDGSLFNAAANNNPMLHADWRGYALQTWSANFHELYSLPDTRAKLTWRGRFAAVVPFAYNFYSSEDEVFEINQASVNMMTGVEFDFDIWLPSSEIHGLERYTWQKQEVFKGRDFPGLPSPIGSTKWWGWGFHHNLLGLKAYSAEEANVLDASARQKDPAFGHYPDRYIHVGTLGTNEVNQMLAMGISAMSPSVGLTNIEAIIPAKNINISTLKANGWPRNHPVYKKRWLHSDCKDVAYLYTYELFNELTLEGGLK
ncbi:MAG: hypothetical protein HOO88_07095 [Kiritimatiellaceae bacterium]|nr:hypothetical protein [Kiritimatiellaceae bacterium]